MRHPTTGLSEDDLSRLTGSSSSTASAGSNNIQHNHNNNNLNKTNNNNNGALSLCSSTPSSPSSSSSSPSSQSHQTTPNKCNEGDNFLEHSEDKLESSKFNASAHFKSTYLPEIINPLDWQKSSRKRKERLDSASSSAQDPKLQRSNSEELVLTQTNNNNKLLEDKLPDLEVLKATADIASIANAIKTLNSHNTATDAIRRVSSEDFHKTCTYAAYLEQELNKKDCECPEEGDSGSSECCNKEMARRSRYCVETSPARSQHDSPVRNQNNLNNNNNNNNNTINNSDSDCENERRRSSERFCKIRAPTGRKSSGGIKKSSTAGVSKHLPSRLNDENAYKYDLSTLKYERRGFISKKVVGSTEKANEQHDVNDNNLIDLHLHTVPPTPSSTTVANEDKSVVLRTAQESLPWDRTEPEDQTPVLSRRYATVHPHSDMMDAAAKLSKIMPYPQPVLKQQAAGLLLENDEDDCMEASKDAFRVFTSIENLRTREAMQQVLPAMMSFQSAEERLKQISKRLTAMKKKLGQLEEAYETRNGYRPSQADRLNDKYMKNIMSELNKLRKERHELKSDPMAALGLQVRGNSLDSEAKLEKMKTALVEIEQNLCEKRKTTQRPECLEALTPDQLVLEKSAVQHGLLYLESMYGRPNTKDERDAARPLYDRYRQLKRMVSRSVLLSSGAVGCTDLPTILEHEAMVFEFTPQAYSSTATTSTETTNSPSESAAPIASSDESTTTSTPVTSSVEQHENIAAMGIDQLWDYLERTREEKKQLKRMIREYECVFEQENGRKMLKHDRRNIENTYAQYKEKKAKARLLQALIKKHISR